MTCPWCSRTDLSELASAINNAVEAAVVDGHAYFVNGVGRRIAGPVCLPCGDVAIRFGGDRVFASVVVGGAAVTPTEFMETLMIGVHSLCSEGPGKPFGNAGFYTDPDELLDAAQAEAHRGRDVWWGVHPLSGRPADGRGDAADVMKVGHLVADIDWNDDVHADGSHKSEAEVLRIVQVFDPAPSIVVHSGHGLHAYWRLDDPVSPEEGIVLTARLHASLRAKGLSPERDDLASVLRVPGTFNRKTDELLEVRVLWAKPGRYTPEYLSKRLPAAESVPKISKGGGGTGSILNEETRAELAPATAALLDALMAIGWHYPVVHRKAGSLPWVALTRPGKDGGGVSVTVGYVAPDIARCFSSSTEALPLRHGRRYKLDENTGEIYDADEIHVSDEDDGNGNVADAHVGNRKASAPDGKARTDSQATELVRLALERYRFAQADDGRSFAVPLDGPALAKPLDGNRGLRGELAAAYFAMHGKAAGRTALADAAAVLEGHAQAAEREGLALRVDHDAERFSVTVDLGTPDGKVVAINREGWAVLDRSPVIFRRTELTAALPAPVDGAASLEHIRDLVNVTDDGWPLLVGWLVATFLGVPTPLLFLSGEQGTGKTRAAKTLANLIDPSPAPVRAAPRDVEQWIVAAAGSHVVAVDNLSTIPDWLSDALCRAATGEGLVRRQLYTDGGLAVTSFQRRIILTSIDAGSLRGDLGERLLPIELERIPATARRTDAELDALFVDLHAGMLANLCSLVSEVLDALPSVDEPELPRMADFGRVLAALDQILGWKTLPAYRDAVDAVAAEVVAGDPLAAAVLELAESESAWVGTASELLRALQPMRPDSGPWPKTPKSLSGALTRLAPAMRTCGVEFERSRLNTQRMLHVRKVTL